MDLADQAYDYVKQRDWTSAYPLFEKLASLDPSNENYWYWLGQISRFRGDYADAITYLNKAIELNPNRPNQYSNYNALGIVYQTIEDYPKAIETFKKSLEIKPHSFYALNSLGLTYKRAGMLVEARKTYDEAMSAIARDLAAKFISEKDHLERYKYPWMEIGDHWHELALEAQIIITVMANDDIKSVSNPASAEQAMEFEKTYGTKLWVDEKTQDNESTRFFLPNYMGAASVYLFESKEYYTIVLNLFEVYDLLGDKEKSAYYMDVIKKIESLQEK